MATTRKYTVGSKVVKAVIKRQPAVKTVAAKVATLTKQVKKLNAISYDKVVMTMDGMATNGASVAAPFFQNHLNALTRNWTPIFGSNAADVANTDKCYINSYKFDCRLTQENEPDRIFYSAFIVSLKDQGADVNTFDPASGLLVMSDGIHYQTLSTGGRVLMNQKFFNIHSYKRFTMGGRPGDQSTPETRDLSFTIVPKQKLLVNPRGNVFGASGLTFPKDPSQNYWFLLFNDDSFADGAVNRITMGGLASIAIPS